MRTRAFLLTLALCAVLVGLPDALAQEPPEASDDLVDQVVASLSARQRVEQLFVVGFQGPEVSPEVRQFIDEHKVGGVFLSRETCNVVNGARHDPKHCGFPEDDDPDTTGQVARLTEELQKAACDATAGAVQGEPYCLPLFIAIDHEGDDRPLTRLLNEFTPIPSNMAIGATFDPSEAETVGCIVGQELAAVGVNMLFGPNLDVLDSPMSGGPGDQGIRVFGGDPRWVGEMGAAYVRGVQRCGEGHLATVVKHFPGHGRSTRSLEYEDVPVVVGKTLEELAQVDLAPFVAVTGGKPGGQGVADGIMNSHLTYTGVPGCDGRTPVTLSPSCAQAFGGLPALATWRQAGGLTVVDDLAAGAVQAHAIQKFGTRLDYSPQTQHEIALEALLAGNDLLPLIRPWQWEGLQSTVDYLTNRYLSDREVRQRVDDAARRIIALKYRLYAGLEPSVVTRATEYRDIVGQAESESQVESIAERALTFIRPASLEEFRRTVPAPSVGQRILFVECWDDPTCATPPDLAAYPPLWPRGKLAGLVMEMFPGRVSDDGLTTISFSQLDDALRGGADDQVGRAVQEADWLVFAFLERDPSRFPDSEVLKDFLGRGPTLFDLRSKKVVVFAYNSPYHLDAGELRNVDLFVALYSKIEPSLRASLKALFQDPTIFQGSGGRGSLPVEYAYGDYVLYDLSEQVEADPTQDIELAVEPEQPVAGERFTVSLAQPLMARNGRRVPDGTSVDFTFQLPDGSARPVSATTTDGTAEAAVTSSQSGEVQLTITSGDLEWSASEPVSVGRLEAEGTPSQPVAAPTTSGGSGGGFPVVLVASLAAGVPALAGGLALVAYAATRRRQTRRPAVAPLLQPHADDAKREPQVEEELRVDPSTHGVYVRGKELTPPLSREQYELLAYLYANRGRLCPREGIIARVWPGAQVAGVSEEALDSLVHRVRERLQASGASRPLVVTVRGQGFRLDV